MEWLVLAGILALASQSRAKTETENEQMSDNAIVPLFGFPNHSMRRDAAAAFEKAIAESGSTPSVTSSFRTREQQERLYKLWLEGKGNLAAKPGTSRHEFGLAIDARGSEDWERAMVRNGFKRTVKSEPWHWEYAP